MQIALTQVCGDSDIRRPNVLRGSVSVVNGRKRVGGKCVRLSHLGSAPVAQRLDGGGPVRGCAAEFERSDGGAAFSQICQELLTALKRPFLCLRESERDTRD